MTPTLTEAGPRNLCLITHHAGLARMRRGASSGMTGTGDCARRWPKVSAYHSRHSHGFRPAPVSRADCGDRLRAALFYQFTTEQTGQPNRREVTPGDGGDCRGWNRRVIARGLPGCDLSWVSEADDAHAHGRRAA